jgi:predicted component of type VI protein secretion system
VELLISAHARENGTHNSARCSLDGTLTLGRGPDSPLLLDGTGISREHLRLQSQGEGIFVTDLSSNGTWLNGRRLTRVEPHPFTPADAITIPGFEIRIDLTNTSVTGGAQLAAAPVPIVREADGEPLRTGGQLTILRSLGASLSRVERFLIALALATVVLVVVYLAG